MLVMLVMNLATLFCLGINDPGKNPGTYQDYALQLNPDCYYNWSIYSENNLDNPKFDPMLWKVTEGNITQAVRLTKAYSGKTWLIYNEPENVSQANVLPGVAAQWFNKAYQQIKAADPTAKVACCGNIVSTQGIEWLNKFIPLVAHYPDIWHIHVYINSNKFNDWKTFIEYWWHWNNTHGNLPTYITETCGMYQDNQEFLLEDIFSYRHPLLQRVYWFSAFEEPQAGGWNCTLLNSRYDPTSLGDVFKAKNSLPYSVTPQPEPPTPTQLPTVTPTPVNTVTPIDETTALPPSSEPTPIVDEPIIFLEYYFPLIFN